MNRRLPVVLAVVAVAAAGTVPAVASDDPSDNNSSNRGVASLPRTRPGLFLGIVGSVVIEGLFAWARSGRSGSPSP